MKSTLAKVLAFLLDHARLSISSPEPGSPPDYKITISLPWRDKAVADVADALAGSNQKTDQQDYEKHPD